MKRLQFRHHDEIFNNRSLALEFFSNIVDLSHTASTVFGKSLYAEPMVAKYYDSEGDIQLLFALGVDSPNAPYHIIDSKEIYELIAKNKKAIEDEVKRATSIESELSGSIITEIERAIAAESVLQKNIDAEVKRATDAEKLLQTEINNNKTSIVPVEVSSSNVLEEFALKNALGEVLGSSIKIYKDSSLAGALTGFKGAKYVEKNEDGSFVLFYDEGTRDESIEYLYLIYKDENGEFKLVGIDFENFLMEAEFGDGLKVVDHVASIKIKDGEKYINTNKDGLHTVGIDKAISDSVNELSEIVDGKLTTLNNTLNEKIDNVNDVLSGDIITLDKKIDTEIDTLDSKLTKTITDKETALRNEIISNKINSKDVVLKESNAGTTLEIQTDEITITKKADASTIYDTNIAVLGSLLKIKKVESGDSSIKSRYELQGADGKLIGDPIEMNVESALVDFRQGKMGASINPQTGNYTEGTGDITMDFIYRLEDGTYKLVQIEISKYFTDAHFGRGLNNQDGVVSLKEGDGNEYLVIGEDTISVVGVNAAIEKSKNEAISNAVLSANSYTDTIADGINDNIETIKDFVTSEIENTSNALISTLNEQVSQLNEQINSEISSVRNELDTEKTNRENSINSAVSTMQGLISEESINRSNEISRIQGLIENEASLRTSKDNEILTSLSAETSSIRKEIDNAKNEAINNATLSASTEAKKIAAEEIAKIVDGADTSFDTLKEIADWIQNDVTGAAQIANDVTQLKKDVVSINEDINILNSDENVTGSVKKTVVDSVNEKFIFNSIPVTDITPDESFKNSSLLRKLINNGITYYYVSNKAKEMVIETKDGYIVNLNDYINSLQDTNNNLNTERIELRTSISGMSKQINELTTEISGLNSEISGLTSEISELRKEIENSSSEVTINEDDVKRIIKNYLTGVKEEITIKEGNDKLEIGFADDAIFG